MHAGDYGISDGAKMSNITSLSLPFLHVKGGLYQNKDSGSLISLWSISVLNTLLNHRSTSAPVNLLLLRISAEVFLKFFPRMPFDQMCGSHIARLLNGRLNEGYEAIRLFQYYILSSENDPFVLFRHQLWTSTIVTSVVLYYKRNISYGGSNSPCMNINMTSTTQGMEEAFSII